MACYGYVRSHSTICRFYNKNLIHFMVLYRMHATVLCPIHFFLLDLFPPSELSATVRRINLVSVASPCANSAHELGPMVPGGGGLCTSAVSIPASCVMNNHRLNTRHVWSIRPHARLILIINIILKKGGPGATTLIHTAITEAWRSGEAPTEWKDACMHAIYKGHGSRTSMDVY